MDVQITQLPTPAAALDGAELVPIVQSGLTVRTTAGAIAALAVPVAFSAGTTGLTPSSPTAGNVTLAGTLNATHGGTGQNTWAAGDLLYANGANSLARLTKPSADSILRISSSGVPSWHDLSYGSFCDTTTQTTTANTAKAMTFNTPELSNNVSIVSNSRITFAVAGVYNLQFSAQLTRTDSGTDNVDIWLAKGGVNIANSNTSVTVSGTAAKSAVVAAWNFLVDVNAGEYVEIMWSSPDSHVQITTYPTQSTPTRPAIPSIILTVCDGIKA